MGEWADIAAAHGTRHGTVADIQMPTGRIYRATWEYRGNVCAWWPEDKRRRSPIGLYSPVKFRIVAIGITPNPWLRAA